MSQEKPGSSTPEKTADVKSGNLSAEQAAQRLLEKYTPKPEAKPVEQKTEATETAPVQEAEPTVAAGTVTETPAQTEEVQVEAQATTEAPAEEGEDVLSHNTDLTPEEREKFKAVSERWQEGVNKRIGKEKQKRLDAEAKARELEEKLTQVEAIKPDPVIVTPPVADNPLADVNDGLTLAAREKEANAAINEAQSALDQLEESGQTEIRVGEVTYSRQTLRGIRREAERQLREFIPARHRFLVEQQQARVQLQQDFPEAVQKGSALAKEIQQVKALPKFQQLNYLPDADYVIALALEGARSLAAKKLAKQTATKLPTQQQKPPVSQTATSAAVSTISRAKPNGTAQWEAEKKKVFAKGNVSGADAAALLLKREQLSTSR